MFGQGKAYMSESLMVGDVVNAGSAFWWMINSIGELLQVMTLWFIGPWVILVEITMSARSKVMYQN